MIRLFIISLMLYASRMISAQELTDSTAFREQLLNEVPTSFVQTIDEQYTRWQSDQCRQLLFDTADQPITDSSFIPVFPDSVYLGRLDALQSAITLSYNEIVRNYIELYTIRRRTQLASMLGTSEYYFPLFEEELAAHDMPLELKYLPVIESALNPTARSRARAHGLWQFMYPTGRMYKLEINSFIDERFDPQKSTEAAVHYLNDLYAIYQDWILVIAAYNCGPGNVNKAIRRSGDKKNYWDIYYHLPSETRGYVPAFIAAMYAFNYYKEHNITPVESTLPHLCDTLWIDKALHFDQICKNMDVSVEELRDMNPQYVKDIVPGGFGKSYVLKMPYHHVTGFIDNQDTIFAYKRSEYFDDSDRTANPNERFKKNTYNSSVSGDKVRMVYTVKQGDVPGAIAGKFGVRLTDLKYWNNLNRNLTIRLGQKLVIYVSEKKAEQYKNRATYAGKVSNEAKAPQVETIDGEYTLYTVRKGENLWSIAKKYPGVSDKDLMRWNGISEHAVRDLKAGQKLKIKI